RRRPARARDAGPRPGAARRRRQAVAADDAAGGAAASRRVPQAGIAAAARSRTGQSASGARRGVRVTALATHGPLRTAVRAALIARGWDPERSRFAAAGLSQLVLLLEDIDESVREALVRWSARSGTDVLTGEGWALVA